MRNQGEGAKIQCAVGFDKSGWGYRVVSDRVYGMKAFAWRRWIFFAKNARKNPEKKSSSHTAITATIS